ncbi:conserved hypothetical protein [Curtobacterium sp. 8I-2]|nr:conserved hypothetical protein [Curtobacterium sp. 8I-2]
MRTVPHGAPANPALGTDEPRAAAPPLLRDPGRHGHVRPGEREGRLRTGDGRDPARHAGARHRRRGARCAPEPRAPRCCGIRRGHR